MMAFNVGKSGSLAGQTFSHVLKKEVNRMNEGSENRILRIQELISRHFNEEILRKEYEEKYLRDEISRRRAMLNEFTHLINYDFILKIGGDLGQFIGKGKGNSTGFIQEGSDEAAVNTSMPKSRPGAMEQAYQYERRPDGVIVKYFVLLY